MLNTGIKAPNFELPDQNGTIHTLEEYRGKKVILYFYPKDNTPGLSLIHISLSAAIRYDYLFPFLGSLTPAL